MPDDTDDARERLDAIRYRDFCIDDDDITLYNDCTDAFDFEDVVGFDESDEVWLDEDDDGNDEDTIDDAYELIELDETLDCTNNGILFANRDEDDDEEDVNADAVRKDVDDVFIA